MFSFPFFLLFILFLQTIPTGDSSSYVQICGVGPGNNHQGDSSINTYGGAHFTSDRRGILLASSAAGAGGVVGLATCVEPLHLWDNATRQLSDFQTHFSFSIEFSPKYPSSNYCGATAVDAGLAFFLAPVGSINVPDDDDSSDGDGMGLLSNPQATSVGGNYVAVDFDAFQDATGAGSHVGINIDSATPVTAVPWPHSFTDSDSGGSEEIVEVWFNYSSISKILRLDFIINGAANRSSLDDSFMSYSVDLKEHLPEWVEFGFKYRSSSRRYRYNCSLKSTLLSWSFNATRLNEDYDKGGGPKAVPAVVKQKKRRRLPMLWKIIAAAALGVLIVGLGSYLCIRGRDMRRITEDGQVPALNEGIQERPGSEIEIGPRRFTYDQIAVATNNFREFLGRGGEGTVFRGQLELGSDVAVKRISRRGRRRDLRALRKEADVISKLSHRNVVKLLGWCSNNDEILLVYEFMPRGSLGSILHGHGQGSTTLPWADRFRIARELADALHYLHFEQSYCVLHRDIKPGNILLDLNLTCKLADFGLSCLVDYEKGSKNTLWTGTPGYVAPECINMDRVSKDSDVYSFGIVCLVIGSGKKALMPPESEEQPVRALVDWVRSLDQNGRLLEAADPNLNGDFNQLEMEILLRTGLLCAQAEYRRRPSIKEARVFLDSGFPPSSSWQRVLGILRNVLRFARFPN